MNADTSGSAGWQLVFVSFGLVLILFEVLRGWRLGLPRQCMRLLALIAAYVTAYFGGQLLLPVLRPFVLMPDLVISALGGALFAIVVYALINGAGRFLFKKTSQHDSRTLRLLYGSAGALVGIFFGAFLIWLLLVGVRSVGAIADAEVQAQSNVRTANQRPDQSLLTLLARLKNSVELGSVGDAVKRADVLPTGGYQSLGRVAEVLSKPSNAERFLSFPGAQELINHPKIVALRNDPEIMAMVREGRLLDLLRNPKLIAAVNDPTLVDRVKHFDLQKALDQAADHANPNRAR